MWPACESWSTKFNFKISWLRVFCWHFFIRKMYTDVCSIYWKRWSYRLQQEIWLWNCKSYFFDLTFYKLTTVFALFTFYLLLVMKDWNLEWKFPPMFEKNQAYHYKQTYKCDIIIIQHTLLYMYWPCYIDPYYFSFKSHTIRRLAIWNGRGARYCGMKRVHVNCKCLCYVCFVGLLF